MTQPTTQVEQRADASLPAYFKLLRMFLAICIALGPLAFLLYTIFDPTGAPGRVVIASNAAANPTANQAHLLFGVLASLLLPFGFLAMPLLVIRRTPWLGIICLLLTIPSWVPLSALIALDALTYDMAQMGGGAPFAALWDRFSNDGVMFPYLAIYAACHLLAILLLGIAFVRTRIIPLWATVLLIVSVPLTITLFPLQTIDARTHFALLGFILHLHLVSVLLTIGCFPAAWAMLKFGNEQEVGLGI